MHRNEGRVDGVAGRPGWKPALGPRPAEPPAPPRAAGQPRTAERRAPGLASRVASRLAPRRTRTRRCGVAWCDMTPHRLFARPDDARCIRCVRVHIRQLRASVDTIAPYLVYSIDYNT